MIAFLILLAALLQAQATTGKPSVELHIIKPDTLTQVTAFVHKGKITEAFQCGDDQRFTFDDSTDGIWTCKYFSQGILGDSIRISIQTTGVPYPLFDGLLTLPKIDHPKFGFLIKQSQGQWLANRTSVHQNQSVDNLMVTNQELIITFWSIIVLNIVGLMLWFSKKID